MAVLLSLDYGGTSVVLPVNPEKIEVSQKVNHNKVEIVGMGEIVEAGFANLASVKFESFVPKVHSSKYLPYVDSSRVSKVAWYNAWFKDWANSRKPARLILTDTNTINMLVLCDQYDFYHQGGDTEDMYYSLSLTAYREYSPKLVAVNSQGSGATSTNRGLTVGAECIVNGQLHLDSWGNGAGLTERNARRVITHISPDPTRAYPIHVALIGGTSDESTRLSHWRGWVTRESVTLV